MYSIRKFISFLIQVVPVRKKRKKKLDRMSSFFFILLTFCPLPSLASVCLSLSLLSCKCPKLKEGRKIQRDREKKKTWRKRVRKRGRRNHSSSHFLVLSFLSNSLQLSLSFHWSLLVGNNTFTSSFFFFPSPYFSNSFESFPVRNSSFILFSVLFSLFFVSFSTLSLSFSLSHTLEVQFRRVTSS